MLFQGIQKLGLITLITLILPCSGLAQEPTTAVEWNVQGKAWYNQREFTRALASFKKAYELDPRARYLFNAAKACLRIEDWESAVAYYQRYLVAAPGAEDAPDVEQEVLALTQRLLKEGRTEVRLESVPGGAQIKLSPERPTEVQNTPGSLFLAPGDYTIQLVLPAHTTETLQLTLQKNGPSPVVRTIKLTPLPKSGTVTVDRTPLKMTLLLDGEPFPASLEPKELPVGSHQLKGEAPGYQKAKKRFVLSAGEELHIPFALEPQIAPTQHNPWKTVALVGAGTGAAIAITGGVLYGVGVNRMDTANSEYDGTPATYDRFSSDYGSGKDLSQWGMGLAVSGTVVAGGALVAWFLLPDTVTKKAAVWMVPDSRGGWSFSFSLPF